MDASSKVMIAGGSGVFGRHLARMLVASTDARVVLVGRDRKRLELAALEVGEARAEWVQLDLRDAEAVAGAARGCAAVTCTAGPFQQLPRDLPLAAVRAGASWFDIADDPGWVLPLLADQDLDEAAAERGVVVGSGLSSVPAISGVLARWCRERLPTARRAQVTLFIGNRNRKGTGATASALIGTFSRPAAVDLPFGRRTAYRFPTPDQELFRRDLGLEAVFRVALEWGYLGRVTAALGRATAGLGPEGQTRLAQRLSCLSEPFARFGTELGCVQVELVDDGRSIAATAVAGQRLVVLPCALAVEALLSGELTDAGVIHPSTWLPVDEYLARLHSRGVRILVRDRTDSRLEGLHP